MIQNWKDCISVIDIRNMMILRVKKTQDGLTRILVTTQCQRVLPSLVAVHHWNKFISNKFISLVFFLDEFLCDVGGRKTTNNDEADAVKVYSKWSYAFLDLRSSECTSARCFDSRII